MGRKILLVTTDQQRYDTLGCNGGTLARTPVVDGLAAAGIRYERAHPQSVVCMPSRSTILTGQHPSHPRRVDERRAPARRRPVGGRGAARRRLPHRPGRQGPLRAVHRPVRPLHRNVLVRRPGPTPPGTGPTVASTTSSSPPTAPSGPLHYARWLQAEHPEAMGRFYPALDGAFAGQRGRRRRHRRPPGQGQPHRPRDWYHTDWVADRTMAWLDSLDADDDWFCWMSFPDPHHPWDPPESEVGRIDWRDVPLPAGYPSAGRARGHHRRQAPALAALVRRRPWSPTTRRRPTGCRPP